MKRPWLKQQTEMMQKGTRKPAGLPRKAKVLKEYAIMPLMSGKGNCWDNACSETLFGSLKVERLHGQRFETIRQAKDETIAWLLWYNQTRVHSTLCYASPIEFEIKWENTMAKAAA